MHEIRAFAKFSEITGSMLESSKPDEKLYDIRFEVRRSEVENKSEVSQQHQSNGIDSKSSLQKPIETAQTNSTASDEVSAAKRGDSSDEIPSGIWQSSLTSLLNPIASFWPLSSTATTNESKPVNIIEDSSKLHADPDIVSTTEAVGQLETSVSEVTQNISVIQNAPKSKAPPAGRIAERLAVLRKK